MRISPRDRLIGVAGSAKRNADGFPPQREARFVERSGPDKFCACMNHTIGHLTSKTGSYQKAPLYFDACWEWHQALTEDQKDWVLYVIDNFTAFGQDHAKRCAARLPPAPRCPL
jgi:hypothetical protein